LKFRALLFLSILVLCTSSCSRGIQSKGLYVYPFNTPPVEEVKRAYHASIAILKKGSLTGLHYVTAAATILKWEEGKPVVLLSSCHIVDKEDNGQLEAGLPTQDEDDDGEKLINFYIKFPIKVKACDTSTDLALFESTEPAVADGPSVKVAPINSLIGDFVWHIGSPGGRARTVAPGYIVALLKPLPPRPLCYRSNITIDFGSSGGGIFNTRGELVGVTRSHHLRAFGVPVPFTALHVHTSVIRDFLAKHDSSLL